MSGGIEGVPTMSGAGRRPAVVFGILLAVASSACADATGGGREPAGASAVDETSEEALQPFDVDYIVTPETLESMLSHADAVLAGTVVREDQTTDGPADPSGYRDAIRYVDIRVDDVLASRGAAPDAIRLRTTDYYLLGPDGSQRHLVPFDEPLMEVGGSYTLFVRRDADGWFPVNGDGLFAMDEDGSRFAEDDEPFGNSAPSPFEEEINAMGYEGLADRLDRARWPSRQHMGPRAPSDARESES